MKSVSPAALNSAHGGTLHDAPFLDLETMLAMPAGFTAARGYDTTELLELATYERLFILRRRAEILGPIAKHDPLTADAAALYGQLLSRPNHYSQSWARLLCGGRDVRWG